MTQKQRFMILPHTERQRIRTALFFKALLKLHREGLPNESETIEVTFGKWRATAYRMCRWMKEPFCDGHYAKEFVVLTMTRSKDGRTRYRAQIGGFCIGPGV